MLIVHWFVSYAHVNLCHFFSSSGCRGLAATSACGSSWTFLFTFMQCQVWALSLEQTNSTSENVCKLYTDSLTLHTNNLENISGKKTFLLPFCF